MAAKKTADEAVEAAPTAPPAETSTVEVPTVTDTQAELHGPVPTSDTPTNGIEQVQDTFNEITAQGFVGSTPDDAPNSDYTHPAHGGS